LSYSAPWCLFDLLHYVTYCHQDVDFGHQLPDFLSSAVHDSSLSATAHSLLLDRNSERVYWNTFILPHHIIPPKAEIPFI